MIYQVPSLASSRTDTKLTPDGKPEREREREGEGGGIEIDHDEGTSSMNTNTNTNTNTKERHSRPMVLHTADIGSGAGVDFDVDVDVDVDVDRYLRKRVRTALRAGSYLARAWKSSDYHGARFARRLRRWRLAIRQGEATEVGS